MALNWQDITNTARELQKSQRNDHQEKAKEGFLRDFHNEGHFLRRVLSMNDHDLCTEFTSQFGESMISHFDRSLIWLKNGICALETVVEKAVALRAAQTKLREESRTKAGKEQREEIRAGQRASEMPQEDSSEEEPSGSESDERKKTKRDQKKRRRNRRVRNKRRRDASSSESEVRKVRKKRSHSKTKKNNSAESSPSSAHRPYLDFHFSASSPSLSGVSDYDALLAEFHRRNEKKKKLSQAEKNEKQDTRQLALDKKEEHRRKLRVEAFQEQEDQDSRDFVTDDTDSSAYCAPVVSKPDGGENVLHCHTVIARNLLLFSLPR